MYILVVHVLMYFSIKIIVLDMLSYYLYSNQNKIHDNSVILMRNVSKELLEKNTTHMYYTYVLHICTTHMYYTYVLHICTTHMYHTYVPHICTTLYRTRR